MVGIGQIENRDRRGGSLVEAMLSLLILLTAVVGMAAAFQNRVFQMSAAKNTATAAIIAQSVANEMMGTDPMTWDESVLEATYKYNFEGDRTSSDENLYYWVDVEWRQVSNWYQVEIGVLWRGWEAETGKTGAEIDDADFAYVLDVSMAPGYGEVL